MAYDNTSTHPVTQALIRQAGEGDANASALAEQLEWVLCTTSTDISALKLPNTFEVHVRDDDGQVEVYAYDANITGTDTGIITDQDGRKFVITEMTLSYAEYEALPVKHLTTIYNIKET